jgi:GNAT superfamily N-acetyltransferase
MIRDETLCKSLGVQWGAATQTLFSPAVESGMSLMAVTADTDEIMGLRLCHLIKVGDEPADNATLQGDEAFAAMLDYYLYQMKPVNFFDIYNTKEVFHFFGLTVERKYRRKGLGKFLLTAGVALGKELGFRVVSGEASANYSIKIYQDMGFEELHSVNYADYTVNGVVVVQNTGEHKSCKVFAKVV